MGIKRIAIASLAIAACIVGSSVASAQSTGISSLARRLESQAHRTGILVDDVFANSRLLRSMVRDTYDIEDAASQLQFLDQTGAGRFRMNGQLARVRAEIDDLCRLVDLSESRALRGIDPPICGCIDTLRASLESMRCTHRELVRALEQCGNAPRGGFSGAEPILLLEPPRGGYGYPAYEEPGFSGRGHGSTWQDGWDGSMGSGGYGGRGFNEPMGFDSRPVGSRPMGSRPVGDRPVGNRPQANRPSSFHGNGPTVILTPDGVRVDGLTFDLGRIFN